MYSGIVCVSEYSKFVKSVNFQKACRGNCVKNTYLCQGIHTPVFSTIPASLKLVEVFINEVVTEIIMALRSRLPDFTMWQNETLFLLVFARL
jgi:hypothetical protein